MKKKLLTLAVLVMAAIGLMSFTNGGENHETTPTTIPVPTALQEKVINTAVSHHFISESDAQAVRKTDCIQRAVNAFVSSGYEPSAAVDEVAKCAVESGKFKTEKAAKAAMKRGIERARHNESNWQALYKICGL